MAKRTADARKRRIEELKRQQHQAQRRGTIIAIVIALLLGSGLIVGAVLATRESAEKEVGVALDEAGCGDVFKADEKKGSNDHVETGKLVEYDRSPPTSGPHWDPSQVVPSGQRFHDKDSNLQAEQFVHNLEHGYTVIWYDPDKIADGDLEALRELTERIRVKFMVAPWGRAPFTDGKPIAMTSWARQRSCDRASGEAVRAFYDEYGVGGDGNVAPEPAGF